MNYLQPTVCKIMVSVQLHFDRDLCSGSLCSHSVHMVAHVVVHKEINALPSIFGENMVDKVHSGMTLTIGLEHNKYIYYIILHIFFQTTSNFESYLYTFY